MASNTAIRRPPTPPLIPPFRFALVEDGVYRGAHPSLKNARYLARLQLASVVSLLPDADDPAEDLTAFCAGVGARHFIHAVAKYDDGFSHTPALVSEVLAQLLDPANHPVLLHCLDGRQNTGIIVMCLRKLQNWGLQAILGEFARYTKGHTYTVEEQQFVQTFNFSAPIPSSVPVWFAARVRFGLPLSVEAPTSPEPILEDGTETESPSVPLLVATRTLSEPVDVGRRRA